MKKLTIFILAVLLIFNYSCITDQNKYKETDIFEDYETENGFTVLHIPPVLFKIVISASEESDLSSKELTDKIELIKLMFFEEKGNTMKMKDIKDSMNAKVSDFNYNLLTRIAEKNNDISIYVIEIDKVIHEVLITIASENSYVGMNLIGNFTQDEIMKVYKAINMQKIQNFDNN
jgi:hypothetical protein